MRTGRTVHVSQEQQKFENQLFKIIGTILLTALTLGAAYYVFGSEKEHFERAEAYNEVSSLVHPLSPYITDSEEVDSLLKQQKRPFVHFQTDKIRVEDSKSVRDEDFNLDFTGAVRVQRHVEYCQWQEYSSDETVRDEQGRESTTRTYSYIKGWRSSPLLSLHFNQPFGHFNPNRDPFPKQITSVKKVILNNLFEMNTNLIEKLDNFKNVYFRPQQLRGKIDKSIAGEQHHFKYIGNGYFYSAYSDNEDWKMKIAKYAGMALDETLLDFQLGDLFSTCEAGDIRVWFSVVEPTKLSVMAQVSQKSGQLYKLQDYITSRGYPVSLAFDSYLSPKQMMEKSLSDHKLYTLLIMRISLFAMFFINALVILHIRNHYSKTFAFVCSVAAFVLYLSLTWYLVGYGTVWLVIAILSSAALFSVPNTQVAIKEPKYQ